MTGAEEISKYLKIEATLDKSWALDAIGVSECIKHFGNHKILECFSNQELLDYVGKDEAINHFDIEEHYSL